SSLWSHFLPNHPTFPLPLRLPMAEHDSSTWGQPRFLESNCMAQTAFGSIAIIVGCILSALLVLALLRHYWKPATRLAHNDVVGPNVSVIGTTYAVLIAFMLSGVWNNLQVATLNAEQEANSLVNIFRFAYQLPSASRAKIHELARAYCQAMLT